MASGSETQITRVLEQVEAGQESAARELFALVYDELHRLASLQLRGQPANHTLQATALVNETYLKLFSGTDRHLSSREHFFAVAGRAMRSILVDHARRKARIKRTPPPEDDPLEVVALGYADRAIDLLALDAALEELGERDEHLVRLVELRFFAGLSQAEIAKLLDVSPRTLAREWNLTRAWLRRRIT